MNKVSEKQTRSLMTFIIMFYCLYPCTTAFAQEYSGVISYTYLPDKIIQANKIKRQEIYEYTITGKGKTDSTFLLADNYTFDDKGNIVTIKEVNKKGVLLAVNTYKYNSLNQLTEEISGVDNQASNNFGFRIPVVNYVFSYDSVGRNVYSLEYNTANSVLRTLKNVYDSAGRHIKVLIKIDKGEFETKNVLYYDSKENLVKVDFIESRKDHDHSYNFEYDFVQNTRTVLLQYGSDIQFFEKIRYNGNKQIVARTTTLEGDRRSVSADKRQMIDKFIYNADGTINSEVVYIDGVVTHFYKRFYFK